MAFSESELCQILDNMGLSNDPVNICRVEGRKHIQRGGGGLKRNIEGRKWSLVRASVAHAAQFWPTANTKTNDPGRKWWLSTLLLTFIPTGWDANKPKRLSKTSNNEKSQVQFDFILPKILQCPLKMYNGLWGKMGRKPTSLQRRGWQPAELHFLPYTRWRDCLRTGGADKLLCFAIIMADI